MRRRNSNKITPTNTSPDNTQPPDPPAKRRGFCFMTSAANSNQVGVGATVGAAVGGGGVGVAVGGDSVGVGVGGGNVGVAVGGGNVDGTAVAVTVGERVAVGVRVAVGIGVGVIVTVGVGGTGVGDGDVGVGIGAIGGVATNLLSCSTILFGMTKMRVAGSVAILRA